jgi:endonuclease G
MCNLNYVIYWNEKTRNPFYSAEMLLSSNLVTIPRDGDFYKNYILDTATTEDYTNSGYDRGHLTPSADANSSIAQKQTFDLANVAPQEPSCNRIIWKKLECDTRRLVKSNPGVKFFIITGVYGSLGDIKETNIPMYFYKIIINTKTKSVLVYRLKNVKDSKLEVITIEALQKETGLNYHL